MTFTQNNGCTYCGGDAHMTAVFPWKFDQAAGELLDNVAALMSLPKREHGEADDTYRGRLHNLLALRPQPSAAQSAPDEREAWTVSKPTEPGAYWVRGNGLEADALVQVKLDDGELWCNLHMSTTEPDFGYGYSIEQLSDDFEWLGPLHFGASRQRAQSAPVVPEGELPWTGEQLARAWYLAEYGPGHDLAPGYAVAFARELAAMLAVAPQPAAQVPAGADELQPWEKMDFSSMPRKDMAKYIGQQNYTITALRKRIDKLESKPAARQEQGDEVRRLQEAVARADDVLAALTACTAPLARLERKFGKDWCQSVDKVRSELIAALSASAEGKA